MAPVTDNHQAGPVRGFYECSITFTRHPHNGPAERLTHWCTVLAHPHSRDSAKNLTLLMAGSAFPCVSPAAAAKRSTRRKPCGQAAFCSVPRCHQDGFISPSSPHAAKPASSFPPGAVQLGASAIPHAKAWQLGHGCRMKTWSVLSTWCLLADAFTSSVLWR